MVEKRTRQASSRRSSKAWLDALIEEATVDCYNEEEQATVERVDLTGGGEVMAFCRRGREKQVVPLLSVQRSSPPPAGFEWVEA